MESSRAVSALAVFARQMRQNGFFLLTVVLAVGASIYFGVGLYVLLTR